MSQMKMSIFLALLTIVRGIELDWIPSGDGPLPLSAAYRERLTRLCDVVDRAQGPLPPSILERLEDIERMCKKLRRSQRAGPISKIKIGLATLVGAGTGAWAYNSYVNKGWVYKQVKEQQRVMQKKKRPGLYSSNSNRSPYYPGYSSYLSNN